MVLSAFQELFYNEGLPFIYLFLSVSISSSVSGSDILRFPELWCLFLKIQIHVCSWTAPLAETFSTFSSFLTSLTFILTDFPLPVISSANTISARLRGEVVPALILLSHWCQLTEVSVHNGEARANWLLTHPCNKALPPSVPESIWPLRITAAPLRLAPPVLTFPRTQAYMDSSGRRKRATPGLFLQLALNTVKLSGT